MFPLRHALTLGLTLVSSCSVYGESLLAPGADGQDTDHAGSLAVDLPDDQQRGGSKGVSGNTGGKAGAAQGGGGGSGDAAAAGTGGTENSAGTGGSSSDGGSSVVGGGAGGTAGSAGAPQLHGVDLLDDMEDGNFYLTPQSPRYGFWYVAGDTTVGAKLPEIEELVGVLSPARDSSTQAVHFAASGFTGWGSSVGLSFTNQASQRSKYDAGDATGISFWVRGTVASNAKLRVLFPLPGTDPIYELCGAAVQGECLDHYATQISVTGAWQQVSLPFSSLHQAGWGAPVAAFDATEMLGIEWSAGTANLDVWLDDLVFTRP